MDKLDTKEIPEKPGIYIFKDKFEEPLYVGKAKNLRKRVPSYFGQNTSWKVKRLINEAFSISFVVSQNEANALLAEYSFIQEFKPKYNIQFFNIPRYLGFIAICGYLLLNIIEKNNSNKSFISSVILVFFLIKFRRFSEFTNSISKSLFLS